MGLCDSVNVLDLSNNNSDKKCLIETQKEITENPDGTETKYIKDENGNETKFVSYAYYENGVLSNKSENILENEKAKTIILERYDKNGNCTSREAIAK